MEKEHKTNGEKSSENIGQEHGTVIVARLGKEVFVALVAALLHFKGFLKAEAAGFEHVTFVAVGAFDVENAVCFGTFAEHVLIYSLVCYVYKHKIGEKVSTIR